MTLRGDLSNEDDFTAYLDRLLFLHNLGVVMDIVQQGHLEMSKYMYLRAG